MLNQLNTTTKRELDVRYLVNSETLKGSKEVTNTSGTISIPDYGLTESIDLYFKPSQDLHGYSKPWAGGAGKNLYNKDDTGISIGEALDPQTGITYLSSSWSVSNYIEIEPSTAYTLNAMPSGNSAVAFYDIEKAYISGDTAFGTKITPSNAKYLRFDYKTEHSDVMQLELGSTATSYEPYSNICPIVGQDNATLSWNTNQGISMNFGTTYYGGIANFDGSIISEWDYIASYNGETLSGEWLSDRDEYVAGTTPTTGAEVVYKTTPSTIRVTQPANNNLTDEYPITYNGYKLDVTYQPKDTILEQAKSYTNQQIKKLGLPQPPTTNGNYQLICTVSNGTPTISWETIQ